MKRKLFLDLLLIVSMQALFAQGVSNNNEWEVNQAPEHAQQWREGELIVKFKDDGAVRMKAPQRTKFKSAGVSGVTQLLETLGVDSVEELMPLSGKKQLPRKLRTHNGAEIEPKPMSKVYRLKLAPEKQMNIWQAIDTLKTLDEVEYAEPNYVVYIQSTDSDTYVQEPLYSQQWGLQAINMHKLWNKPKITQKRPVIAILDTGIDIEHPDLAANIWTNDKEAEGLSGQDDDNNGFADDIHGWDFINQTGTIRDFNGHGTHCAGIAAAVGNNGIGITGANPDALIMPITVMQSDGTGDVATIIKGIDYAVANGADVLSMSFGSYSYSIAEEQALGRAYANAVLVAAAGNEHISISDVQPCEQHGSARMFPAAFTFVLGVEASTQYLNMSCGCYLAPFSNYDPDGPIYSEFGEEQLYNYELRAPGANIYSTFPNGRYKTMNGTSMACPLVAGAVSRLLQCKEYDSKELLFGDLIHTANKTTGNIDISAAYDIDDSDRKPTLWLVGYNLTDSIGGDGDGRPDAGEKMEIYPIFRNDWGQAENIRYWLKLGFYNDGDWVDDDASLITFLTDTVSFNRPLSSYAKSVSENPLRFKISENAADGRHINVTIFAVCDNMSDTLKQTVRIDVVNGVEIGGMITEDMTLYPNVHYIVTKNLAVPAGVTLTIKPGTVLKFGEGIGLVVNGEIHAWGTPDSMIVFTKRELSTGWNGITIPKNYYTDTLKYVIVSYTNTNRGGICGSVELCNCILMDNTYIIKQQSSQQHMKIDRCNITSNNIREPICYSLYSCQIQNTNFINNNLLSTWHYYGLVSMNWYYLTFSSLNTHSNYNSYIPNKTCMFYYDNSDVKVFDMSNLYFGSSKSSIVYKQSIVDINNPSMSIDGTLVTNSSYFDLSNMLTRPVREAHGIVWKVVINGYDAQDEFDELPPLGVGKHKCEVYFNRPMDVSVAPYIAYGVRPPYTQHAISDEGSWSADSTVYTAYFTIDGKTASDGLNRLYVADARDDEHFEIPLENFRFNMQIASAGSMSTGLMAEAGLGKVTLTWETDEEDFADLLGYNIYRYTMNEGVSSDSIIINESVIDSEEQTFTDFDVVPGTTYYYVIKQLTTSLSTYALSNAVAATPLTAQKGDANGSMSVNVADVLTEVAYIMHEDPQPFIFEAADVNDDGVVNIFDVVGTVNLILNPSGAGIAAVNSPAYYTIEDGILYVETDVVLGGVQFTFTAEEGATFEPLEALSDFERVGQWQSENQYLFMAYSMSGKTLLPGKHALLRIGGDAELTDISLSDPKGKEVATMKRTPTSLLQLEQAEMQLMPNPFRDALNINYVIGTAGKQTAQIMVTDVTGRTVDVLSANAAYGAHTLTWKPASLSTGIYFLTLQIDGVNVNTQRAVKE